MPKGEDGQSGALRRVRGLVERLRPGRRRESSREEQVDAWFGRLVERGLSPEWADRLAPRLVEEQRALGCGAAAGMLAGAVIASEVQGEERAEVERNLRDVREVERLLGAFSGELEKLDEVLEVLAAYAKRMRTPPSKSDRRLLH